MEATKPAEHKLSEAEYWKQEATNVRRTGLKEIRAIAEKWQNTIATLLGVLGIVAFVEGPKKLEDLPDGAQAALIAAVGLAALLGVVAVYLAALAAQGLPKKFHVLTGPALAKWRLDESDKAVERLRDSRLFAGGAAIVLIAGTLTAWIIGLSKEDGGSKSAVVITSDGSVTCGTLKSDASGRLTVVAEDGTSAPGTARVTSLTVVDTCPEP